MKAAYHPIETAIQVIFGAMIAGDLIVWWLGARVLQRARVRRAVRLGFHAFLAVQTGSLLLMLITRVFNLFPDLVLPTALAVVVLVWHLLGVPVALLAYAGKGIGEGTARLVRSFKKRAAASEKDVDVSPEKLAPTDASYEGTLTRREFLGATVAISPPVLSLALSAASANQLSNFRMRRITINLPQLPQELDGMTIAHVSDTHLGTFTHGAIIQKIIDETNALRADVVVFAGDLINDSLAWLPTGIKMLQAMKGPLVVCEGNHDLIVDRYAFESQVKRAGLKLLVNEETTLTVRGVPVQFLGVRWGGPQNWQHRHDENTLALSMAQLLPMRNPKAFQILLAHHPHAWDYAANIPLTLSGHTHGGQLMINERLGVGPLMFRYWSGVYTRHNPRPGIAMNAEGPQALVVSNGVGNWFPLRTEAPAEIVHITLRRGPLSA